MKVSGKSHSAESPKEPFMPTKRFASRKIEVGFDKNKLEVA